MNYKININNFSANLSEFSEDKIQTITSTLTEELNKIKDISFNISNDLYNEIPSEIYNKLFSIFLNIINKSNDDTIKSSPKKYFDMLLAYSLQKQLKRIYNSNFENNYIPEIVGVYNFAPDDKYNGMVVVFDIPIFIKNTNSYDVSFEISEVKPLLASKNSISPTVNSNRILRDTATYMPYIYNHENLEQVATNKNLRCCMFHKISAGNKIFEIKENNVYDIFLKIKFIGKKDDSKQHYDLLNLDIIEDVNSKISGKSPITSINGYKELNVNDFAQTISNAENSSGRISWIDYLYDYINITYKYAMAKGIFGQTNSGMLNPTGWIFEMFLEDWKTPPSFQHQQDGIDIEKIVEFLNTKSESLYKYSLWPRGYKQLVCTKSIPYLANVKISAQYGGEGVDKELTIDSCLYNKNNKYYLTDSSSLKDRADFQVIDYYFLNEYFFMTKISIVDIQFLNIAKLITYLLILAEQGCFIGFKSENNINSDMPMKLAEITGDRQFNRFDGCEYTEYTSGK